MFNLNNVVTLSEKNTVLGNGDVSFLACTKVKLWDLIVCITVNGNISKSRHDLDLGPAMPNIELDRDIFIYFDVFKVSFIDRLLLELSCKIIETQKHRNMETWKHTHTHTDSDEFSIVLQKRNYNKCDFNFVACFKLVKR